MVAFSLMVVQVLRKYSDKTVARDLVRELESYAGDPANLVMSGKPYTSPLLWLIPDHSSKAFLAVLQVPVPRAPRWAT